jgi:guanosine-3',5'-bis(diphosphate) 3'-pyrophosphohydrolase
MAETDSLGEIIDTVERLGRPGEYGHLLAICRDGKKPIRHAVLKALDFAYHKHEGHRRKSGAPYIIHPLAVAEIIAGEFRLMDPNVICAALLHDVVEDVGDVTLKDIETVFGRTVAEIVDGCTKLTRRRLNRAQVKDLTHSKLLLSASQRIEVLVVKLADRLHNIRTLQFLAANKRRRISHETIDVYVPIAAMLNLYPVKRELQDNALAALYPQKSKKILKTARDLLASDLTNEVRQRMQTAFEAASMSIEIRQRIKGLGAYYSPQRRTLSLSNAENLIDFTLLVESPSNEDCYRILGITNRLFAPIPKTIRDFIANPKPAGYQSLHVRVVHRGQMFLIKIRTHEMDEAAHFSLPVLTEAANESRHPSHEIRERLKGLGEYDGAASKRKELIRLSGYNEITVFTPKGDQLYFPHGSIVLDFAYKIHTEVGDRCSAAIVNRARVPLTHLLEDGDVVEILTGSGWPEALSDLETRCKTPKARHAVNKRLQQKRRRFALQIGKEVLDQEMRRCGFDSGMPSSEQLADFLEYKRFAGLDDMLISIGQDKLSPKEVLWELFDACPGLSIADTSQTDRKNSITVGELDATVHKFSKCCHPFPGQQATIANLSERGIAFHDATCQELTGRHGISPARILHVHWDCESPWPSAMAFIVRVSGHPIRAVIPILAGLSPLVGVNRIEQRRTRSGRTIVEIALTLQGLRDAHNLHSGFLDAGIDLMVDTFSASAAGQRQSIG